MYLQTQVIGYLGKDATINILENGKKVVNFSVAYTEKFRNSQGVQTEKTTWIECAKWDSENIAPYLKKGTQVMVIGKPKAEAYTAQATGELKATLKLSVSILQLLGSAKKDDQPAASQAVATDGGEQYVHEEKAKNKGSVKPGKFVPPANEPTAEPVDDLPF